MTGDVWLALGVVVAVLEGAASLLYLVFVVGGRLAVMEFKVNELWYARRVSAAGREEDRGVPGDRR